MSLSFWVMSLMAYFGVLISFSALAQATRPMSVQGNDAIVCHGKLVKPDGKVVEGSVNVTVKIFSPEPELCLLWIETQSVAALKGAFAMEVGHSSNRVSSGAGSASDGAPTFRDVFLNASTAPVSSSECASGYSTYTPSLGDDRLMTAIFDLGGTIVSQESIPIKSVPFAKQAAEIGGFGVNNLMKVSGTGSSIQFTPAEVQSLKDLLGGSIDWDLGGQQLTNVADPVAGTDATNKQWVVDYVNNNSLSNLTSSDVVSALGYTPISSTSSSEVQTALGFTPVNRAGDAMTGSLSIPSNGLTVGSNQLVVTGGNIGIGTASPTEKLEVSGKVKGSELCIGGDCRSSWPASGGGGAVQSVNVGGLPLSVINSSTTPTVSIAQASGSTSGYLTSADWQSFNSKLGAGTSFSGDVSGAYNSLLVQRVRGVNVSATAPNAAGQVLRYDGTSAYVPAFLSLADIRSTAIPGNTMFPATSCTAAQTMTWSSLTDTMTCTNIAINASAVSGLGTLADNNSVNLSGAEATGILSAGRFPALSGAITTTAGSLATTLSPNVVGTSNIVDNSVSNSDLRQGVARSVVGVTGNATANVADIQGTANQVLRVDNAGTGLAFGAINLASAAAVSGTLPVGNGGTGLTAAPTNGQILIGNGTGYTLATITAGSGITITNNAGQITIAASGGSVPAGTWCGVRAFHCSSGTGISYNGSNRACNGTTLTASCAGGGLSAATCPSGYTYVVVDSTNTGNAFNPSTQYTIACVKT